MVGCAWTIEVNFVEARLHLLEALGFADQHALSMADAVKVQGGTVRLQAPEPKCAADELALNLMAMHVGGFFRALGSALDCIGGLAVGVLALPTRIYRADLGSAQKAIERELKRQNDSGQLRSKMQQSMDDITSRSGPEGWLPEGIMDPIMILMNM